MATPLGGGGAGPSAGGKAPKLPKVSKVKNKAPAELQITAEQLLREAKERQLEIVPAPPKQKIQDAAELADYQLRKRKEFEDNIRKSRALMANWFKYASWEEAQKEVQRARSVFERALDVEHRNISLWIKYAEMEMRNKQVNHARNLWDRAVTVLPRANQFWYKYVYMEEMLENVAGCRAVFERWMEWEPEEQAWLTYIKFELRYKELDRARSIYERFVFVHPEVKNWIRFAKFEEGHGFVRSARAVYERAVEFFGEEYLEESLYIAFARFEEGQKEHERARVVYKYALDLMPKDQCVELYKAYTIHEKKFGERAGIETVILKKRRLQYEEEVADNPNNYDAWFDLIRLVVSEGERDLVRETFERAVANVPPSREKQFWRRYIYLWINYAVYEELEAEDVERARQVYRTCLELIPHRRFTFAKVWLLYAQFEIRQKEVGLARQALGTALGKCPKAKLFRGYIDLEIQLREFQRCRKLYEKFLLFDQDNCAAWMKYAELETLLGDTERARSLYDLAIHQPRLDMPEILWKAYIDFEIDQDEHDRARDLYRQLLERTQHVKVWMSFAQFELSVQHEDRVTQARHVYEEANKSLRTSGAEKEQRLMLLEAWRDFEEETLAAATTEGDGDDGSKALAKVRDLMPKRVKRRRRIGGDGGDGADAGDQATGWEEYFDYIFPEDEGAKPNLKLLAMAKMWKKQKQQEGGEGAAAAAENAEVATAEGAASSPAAEDAATATAVTAEGASSSGEPAPGRRSPADDSDDEEERATPAAAPTPADVDRPAAPANPDADDEEMKNESSSSSDSE